MTDHRTEADNLLEFARTATPETKGLGNVLLAAIAHYLGALVERLEAEDSLPTGEEFPHFDEDTGDTVPRPAVPGDPGVPRIY